MSKKRPTIEQSLIDKISAIKPKYITTNGFIHMLLEDAYNDRVNKKQNLTNNVDYIYTNNKELEDKKLDNKSIDKNLERKEQKEKINKKEKQEKNIPDDLKHFQTLIDDFWKVKNTEYRKFIDKYSEQILKDQLEAGILAGTWKGLKLSHYEEQQQRMNRFNKEPETSAMHPNQKVVQFDDMGNLI